MSNKESRRRVPVSAIAIIVFAVLVVFEVMVLGGVFGIKPSTVARIAPWAYEPFLRLVGEHPESSSQKASTGRGEDDRMDAASGIATVAGFNTEELTIDLDALTTDDGTASPEEDTADGAKRDTQPAESSPSNPPPDRTKEAVPVG